jgi:hypothetical protein
MKNVIRSSATETDKILFCRLPGIWLIIFRGTTCMDIAGSTGVIAGYKSY